MLADFSGNFGTSGAEAGKETENVNTGKGTNKSTHLDLFVPTADTADAAPHSHCLMR